VNDVIEVQQDAEIQYCKYRDVSEEHIRSIFLSPVIALSYLASSSALKIEAVCSSEITVDPY
jgi:hypothetical protein